MRKTRSDSKLLNLPEEQQAQIADWLLSGMPYYSVVPMIEQQFQVKTSTRALCEFYRQVCQAALIKRRWRAVETANEVATEAARNPGQFDQATIDALKQKAFELSISPQADPRDVKSLFALVLKSKDQDLADRQLKLKVREYEDKLQAAKASLTQAVSKGGIAPETLKTIEETLNLL